MDSVAAPPATDAGLLFRPFDLKGVALRNRLVMAPMTKKCSPGGVPTADVAAYYRRRAEGGVGLIVTEGAAIPHPVAVYDDGIPHLYGAAALAGWRDVIAAVHAADSAIFAQLWHVGGMRMPGEPPNPEMPAVSPSGLKQPGLPNGVAMTQADIDAVVAAYGEAAANAKLAGFDGVEIHGAHGYLIDQFFWTGTNRRTDGYNGDLTARTRFGREVVAEIRRRVGPGFPICFRLSQWKQQDYAVKLANSPAELEALLGHLIAAGVDILHCSTRRIWEPSFEGSTLNLAGWAKKLTGLPTITVGSVGLDGDVTTSFGGRDSKVERIDQLLEMMARDEFDLVAVGRALLGDPGWANKVRDGRYDELLPFQPAQMRTLV